MAVTSNSAVPYAPASAVLEIVSRHRSRGLPSPVNADVLGRAGVSNSLIPRTLQALQVLDLIDDKGAPTPTFESLRLAPEAEYKQRLAQWLNGAYADVLNFVDPGTADEVAVRDAFRNYNPVGQQPRMVSLFLGLYAAAGIGPEKASQPRQPRRSRVNSGGSGAGGASPTKPQEPAPAATGGGVPRPLPVPPASGSMSDTALEYKLVDLLKKDDIGDEQRAAVWTLIQYLTARPKNKAADPS